MGQPCHQTVSMRSGGAGYGAVGPRPRCRVEGRPASPGKVDLCPGMLIFAAQIVAVRGCFSGSEAGCKPGRDARRPAQNCHRRRKHIAVAKPRFPEERMDMVDVGRDRTYSERVSTALRDPAADRQSLIQRSLPIRGQALQGFGQHRMVKCHIRLGRQCIPIRRQIQPADFGGIVRSCLPQAPLVGGLHRVGGHLRRHRVGKIDPACLDEVQAAVAAATWGALRSALHLEAARRGGIVKLPCITQDFKNCRHLGGAGRGLIAGGQVGGQRIPTLNIGAFHRHALVFQRALPATARVNIVSAPTPQMFLMVGDRDLHDHFRAGSPGIACADLKAIVVGEVQGSTGLQGRRFPQSQLPDRLPHRKACKHRLGRDDYNQTQQQHNQAAQSGLRKLSSQQTRWHHTPRSQRGAGTVLQVVKMDQQKNDREDKDAEVDQQIVVRIILHRQSQGRHGRDHAAHHPVVVSECPSPGGRAPDQCAEQTHLRRIRTLRHKLLWGDLPPGERRDDQQHQSRKPGINPVRIDSQTPTAVRKYEAEAREQNCSQQPVRVRCGEGRIRRQRAAQRDHHPGQIQRQTGRF